MVCGYCQDVGKASQGLKPAANNAARAKQKDRETHTHRIKHGKKCFSIVRNAHVKIKEKREKKKRGSLHIHLVEVTFKWAGAIFFLNPSIPPFFSCSLCATVIWSCHKQILLTDLSKMSGSVKRDDGLQKSGPWKLLSVNRGVGAHPPIDGTGIHHSLLAQLMEKGDDRASYWSDSHSTLKFYKYCSIFMDVFLFMHTHLLLVGKIPSPIPLRQVKMVMSL